MTGIYTIAEAAAKLKITERWLADPLRARRFPAHKMMGQWRMTDEDIAAALDVCAIPARPRHEAGYVRRQRRPVDENKQAVSPPKVQPLPSWFSGIVHAELPEFIANMPGLTETQQELLDRVCQERQVVVNGRARKTVEALALRGLVTYDGEYVLNADTRSYFYPSTALPFAHARQEHRDGQAQVRRGRNRCPCRVSVLLGEGFLLGHPMTDVRVR